MAGVPASPVGSLSAKQNWRQAARKTKDLSDPWEEFNFESIVTRRARRHIYDPRKRIWLKDESHITIKMQDKVWSMVCYSLTLH